MGFLMSGHPRRVSVGQSEFKHRFGGPPVHYYDKDKHPDIHLHCIYLLDTSDPNLPEIVPGISFLPLYYGMLNDGFDMAYQIVTETEFLIHDVYGDLELDFWTERDWEEQHLVIPEEPVQITPLSFEEHKTVLYAHTARRHLRMPQISGTDEDLLKSMGYPFTQIGGIHCLPQGQPTGVCQNPACRSMDIDIFAVVWNNPTPNFCLWGEYGEYTQIIYEICLACHTIHVTNRCT